MTGGEEKADDAGHVIVSVEGPILTVRLNRPEKLNALTLGMHQGLQAALDRFAEDPALRIAILTATGRAFCAGSDVKDAAVRRARGERALVLPRSGYGGIVERFDLNKPVIAAVNGDALGGGFELALACDLIVAVEGAGFSLPEAKLGLVAIGGGPHRLVRAIGAKRTMDIALTGRRVDAIEGLALGFVNRVVLANELSATCREIAEVLLQCGPKALAAAKQLVDTTLSFSSLQEAIAGQERLTAMQVWRDSDEGSEGINAFAQKSPPRWTTG
ncbi:MAG: enoyl-CoA hydratase/isomerase family protein [Rhodobiaceae bacterium]|nr:enoyl-CoA hydratase/isomerase family protein [Novosphingobium sp.]MCC0057587.1 enoyl-CoA hydratase/isomerase family protein [Rhodobiaceae bacterium]